MKKENYVLKSIIAVALLLGILTMFLTYVKFDKEDIVDSISDSISNSVEGSDYSDVVSDIFSEVISEAFFDEMEDEVSISQSGIQVVMNAFSLQDTEMKNVGMYIAFTLCLAWILTLAAIVCCLTFKGRSGYVFSLVLSSVSVFLMSLQIVILPSVLKKNDYESSTAKCYWG